MRPGELGELETVMALLQRAHEKYETYGIQGKSQAMNTAHANETKVYSPMTYSMKLMKR